MTGGQEVSINGANISNGAVGSDGRIVSGVSLNSVSAQGGLSGRTRQMSVVRPSLVGLVGGGQHQCGEQHRRQRGCAG